MNSADILSILSLFVFRITMEQARKKLRFNQDSNSNDSVANDCSVFAEYRDWSQDGVAQFLRSKGVDEQHIILFEGT